MPNVLVLYYSSYGHIEKMAEAIAEGVLSAGARVDIKRVPETVPEAMAKSCSLQARSSRFDRNRGRTGKLRCDHRWDRHALRADVVANGGLPRPGRWVVGEGCVAR